MPNDGPVRELKAVQATLSAVEAHCQEMDGDEPLTPLHLDADVRGHKVNVLLDSVASVNVINFSVRSMVETQRTVRS